MNIYLNIPLPTHTTINFSFLPPPPPTKAERKLEEDAARAAVRRAVNAWLYT
jgi:hypothetical protein